MEEKMADILIHIIENSTGYILAAIFTGFISWKVATRKTYKEVLQGQEELKGNQASLGQETRSLAHALSTEHKLLQNNQRRISEDVIRYGDSIGSEISQIQKELTAEREVAKLRYDSMSGSEKDILNHIDALNVFGKKYEEACWEMKTLREKCEKLEKCYEKTLNENKKLRAKIRILEKRRDREHVL